MKVLNVHHYSVSNPIPEGAVNIMRPSILGNPFRITKTVTRAVVVKLHMDWAIRQMAINKDFREAVLALAGHDVVCCCAPLACHGDNYVAILKGMGREV